MKIKYFISLFFLLVLNSVKAQSLSVVDCSTVLIVPETTTLAVDTSLDITMDSLWNTQSNFNIMFIVQVSDSAQVNKVHIDLGPTAGTSTLLDGEFDALDNTDPNQLIYEPYNNYINIKSGEFTIDSLLHYSIILEDHNGGLSSPYSGTIEK